MTPRAKRYYPLFADLKGRRCVVIGGGPVAQRKARTLRSYGARVRVVSPTLTKGLALDARQGKVSHAARRFALSDLRGAWLVYAATDDQRTNERVFRAATGQRVFVNVVDQPRLCSFIAPAIVRRGALTLAVSTGGASPALAKRLRRDLGRSLGEGYAAGLRLLAALRPSVKRRLPRFADRKRYFERVLEGPIFHQARRGRADQAKRAALALLDGYARNGY